MKGRSWIVLIGFLAAATFFLWEEHRAHLLGILPWAILLLCPILHLFMHRGHGGRMVERLAGSLRCCRVCVSGTSRRDPLHLRPHPRAGIRRRDPERRGRAVSRGALGRRGSEAAGNAARTHRADHRASLPPVRRHPRSFRTASLGVTSTADGSRERGGGVFRIRVHRLRNRVSRIPMNDQAMWIKEIPTGRGGTA